MTPLDPGCIREVDLAGHAGDHDLIVVSELYVGEFHRCSRLLISTSVPWAPELISISSIAALMIDRPLPRSRPR